MSQPTQWNYDTIRALYNKVAAQHSSEMTALYKAHPEINGIGIDIDTKTDTSFLKVILRDNLKGHFLYKQIVRAFKRPPKDIPTHIGELPVKVEYRDRPRMC